jgi:hypothetical protein
MLTLFASSFGLRTTLVERRIGNVYSSYTDFFLYPADYFLVAGIASALIALATARRGLRRGPWWLTLPLCALVALSWLGVLTGVDRELTAYHSFRLTLLLALYFVLVNVPLPASWVAAPLAAGVLIQGLVGMGQFVRQHSLGLQAYGELLLDPQEVGVSIVRDDPLRILRAYGLTDHPNLLGGFLTFALILILGYYFASAHTRARYLLLPVLALGSITLILTFSRAAWLAFAAGIVVLTGGLLLDRVARRARLVPYVVAALVLATSLLVPAYANRNLIEQRTGQGEAFSENSGEARSLTERDVLIASATRLFVKHAVSGVGNGALPLAMYLLDSEFDTTYYYQPAHIVLLQVAVELGIFGGILWLWLIVAPWLAVSAQRRAFFASPWLAALAGALAALTVIGFLDYYPWLLPPGRIMQWSAFGLLGAFFVQRRTPDTAQE